MTIRPLAATLLCLATAAPASAQSLQDRIQDLRQRRAASQIEADPRAASQQSVAQRLSTVLSDVNLPGLPAREAFAWWSSHTGVPLVVDWEALELEGVNPTTPIELRLTHVPARNLLELMLGAVSGYTDLVYDVEPGYVHIMTKAQANRRPVLAVYDVRELIVQIPSFTDAPSFSLSDALGDGGSDGGGGSLFSDQDEEDDNAPTALARGQGLADLVRNSIEPSIWIEAGGTASVRYFDGRLVVRAPKYVQRQIGIPAITRGLPPLGGVGRAVPNAGGSTPPPAAGP